MSFLFLITINYFNTHCFKLGDTLALAAKLTIEISQLSARKSYPINNWSLVKLSSTTSLSPGGVVSPSPCAFHATAASSLNCCLPSHCWPAHQPIMCRNSQGPCSASWDSTKPHWLFLAPDNIMPPWWCHFGQ